MKHYIAYLSKDGQLALGALLKEYGPTAAPAINIRIGVEGTRQRPPYVLAMWFDWLERLEKSRGQHEAFAILIKDEAADGGWRFVGSTSLSDITWPNGTAISGSMIYESGSRGKGYGTVAKLLLLKHAFHILGLRKVHSRVKAWNAVSLGHLLKCGYTMCGRNKQEEFHEGAFVDQLLLEVFRADWERVWDAYQATGELPRLRKEQRALVTKETNA